MKTSKLFLSSLLSIISTQMLYCQPGTSMTAEFGDPVPPGDYSTFCGIWAGYYYVDFVLYIGNGTHNTFVGSHTGRYNESGSHNSFFGAFAGENNKYGNYNTILGNSAGFSNTSGSYNNFIGYRAGSENTIGTDNNFIGYQAGNYNISGTKNNFLGNYAGYSNSTGNFNSFVGYNAGFKNTVGSYNNFFGRDAGYNNTTGDYNIFIGNQSGFSNTAGKYNNFIGSDAGYSNTTGNYNTATGYRALRTNTTGEYNTAYGVDALYSNTTGINNTGIGIDALSNNADGHDNTATGLNVMYSNTTGSNNTANGKQAMFYNTTGSNNTAIGHDALIGNSTGSFNVALGDSAGAKFNSKNNTFLGYKADASSKNLLNTTVIGYKASATASNQVRVGNTSITSIGGQVGWTTFSDGRFKKNIKEDVPGLVFISKLRPVTYTLDVDGLNKALGVTESISAEEITAKTTTAKQKHTGFIAQEVEKAANELQYDFGGVDKPKNETDLYGLRYAEFVVPLVKAVQELSALNEEKNAKINELETRLLKLEALINAQQSSSLNNKQTINITTALLEQNIPNPFNHTTTISYTLPQQYSSAKIIITDKSGKSLKEVNISGNGKGMVKVDAATLPSGAYNYSLIVDGRVISSKQMVLTK